MHQLRTTQRSAVAVIAGKPLAREIQTDRVFCAVRIHRLGVTQGMDVTAILETPVLWENLDGVLFMCCMKTQSRAVAVTRGKSMSQGIYSVLPPVYPFIYPSHPLSRRIIMVAVKRYYKRYSHWKQLLFFSKIMHTLPKNMKLERCSEKPQSVPAPSLRGKSAARVKLNLETLLRY